MQALKHTITMLAFKINEIPKGKSTETLSIESGKLDLAGFEYRNLVLEIGFEKREAALQVSFLFTAEVVVICDRSLEEFWQPVEGKYEVIFKEGIDFDSEDEQMSIRRLDISGNIINIETEVRDSIVLSVPLRKIHPRFFNEDGDLIEFEHQTEESPEIDPRWEALKNLKDNITNN